MNFVLDSSITIAWVMSDESSKATDEILDFLGEGGKAIVPTLWKWEIANVLLTVERKKRATKAEIKAHLLSLTSLPIDFDDSSALNAWTTAFLLAQKHALTSYDAAYLELALRKGLPLATLDMDLRKAAKGEKVVLLPAFI